MPKLDGKAAEQVNQAESGATLIEEGTYEMVLTAVTATGKDNKPLVGPNGPYWKWELTFPEDAPRYAKRKQWVNTSLSESAAWKMKEHFDAFGVSADTDTDDLVAAGARCLVVIGTQTIQEGAQAGEVRNNPTKLLPLDGVVASNGTSKAAGSKAKADLF